jgi:hypothetical protein
MADRPILFSGPMVRALVDGRKTQTRRIVKPQPDQLIEGQLPKQLRICVGDRLWVRETLACCIDWGLFYDAHGGIGPGEEHFLRDERAGAIVERYSRDDETLWNVPSIFMPRWASRLTLTVTDVRIERLCSITEEDAIAEGIEDVTREVAPSDPSLRFWKRYKDGGWNGYVDTAIGSYASLWTEINGPGAWEANPWVAAYTFTVERRNIDAPDIGIPTSAPTDTIGGDHG